MDNNIQPNMFQNPNPFFGFGMDFNQQIRNLENRVFNLEKEVMHLKTKLMKLENSNQYLDNYTSTYNPNTYNMV